MDAKKEIIIKKYLLSIMELFKFQLVNLNFVLKKNKQMHDGIKKIAAKKTWQC